MGRKSIWKFPLEIQSLQLVPMPKGARLLSVQVQGGTICLWAEVDLDASEILRHIWMPGTGHDLYDGDTTFIGTVQTPPFVWHVYDGGEE